LTIYDVRGTTLPGWKAGRVRGAPISHREEGPVRYRNGSAATVAILALALTACATISENAPPYSPAPPPDQGSAIIYLYRVGAYPKLRTPGVYVDDRKIFDPPEKAYTWTYASEGRHNILIDWMWDTGAPDLKFNIDLKSGEAYYIKISGSFESKWLVFATLMKTGSSAKLIPRPEAEKELYECCRYLPSETTHDSGP